MLAHSGVHGRIQAVLRSKLVDNNLSERLNVTQRSYPVEAQYHLPIAQSRSHCGEEGASRLHRRIMGVLSFSSVVDERGADRS